MDTGKEKKRWSKGAPITNPYPLTSTDVLNKLESSKELVITQDKEKQLADWACTPMTYSISDKEDPDTVLFLVAEDASCCCTFFCGPARQSAISVLAPNYEEVATFVRKACRCDAWCCLSCCLCNNVMEVYIHGELIGSVKQRFSAWRPKFTVYYGEEEIATVRAPCCPCRCAMYMSIQLEGKKTEHSPGFDGEIRKVHVPTEAFNTDHETFEIDYEIPDMKSEIKLLCLGAAFMTNLMYFEIS